MTVLTVVKDVCAAVGVMVPSTVFGGINSNRTMQEMASLANEMAQRIAYDLRDWTTLQKSTLLSGDGAMMGFALPADFKRMLLTSNVWRSTDSNTPMTFVPNLDDWQQHTYGSSSISPQGEWTISGGRIWIAPIMPVGTTARFAYLDRNCVTLASGGYGDVFMADGDSFRLDERLLKLGMIWQWMANKGAPYAEPMGTYSDAIANAMGHDQPAPIIIGRRPMSAHGRVAYPWPLPS